MKILMVVTSHDRLGNSGRKTGLWLEELAAPYLVFRDAGLEVTIASPKGGEAPIDPGSLTEASQTEDTRRFLQNPEATDALAQTALLSGIDPSTFDAAFFPGGHGPLWDLTHDRHALSLIERTLAAGKPVALVCHAPGILTNVKGQDGGPIVAGRAVTGFTNAEEAAVHLAGVVPFLLEEVLRRQGAIFSAAADFTPHVVQDGLLVTGQNPPSSTQAALTLLDILRARSPAP